MRVIKHVILVFVVILMVPGAAFGQSLFNPIDDVTDRITVYAKKIDGAWVEVEPGNGIDVELADYLDSLVQEVEQDPPANCSTDWYVSDPVSQAEADLWNFEVNNEQSIGWGGVIGSLVGGVLGLVCDAASGGEGLCTVFIGSAGALAGNALQRALQEQNALPGLSCGFRLAASVTTCEDWSVPTPAPIQTKTTAYYAFSGSC